MIQAIIFPIIIQRNCFVGSREGTPDPGEGETLHGGQGYSTATTWPRGG